MRAATAWSKLVPNLTVDDARDMNFKDAMETFKEQRKLKGENLYSKHAI